MSYPVAATHPSRRLTVAALLCLLLTAGGVPARAGAAEQTTSRPDVITGRVLDDTGAAIAGATVTLRTAGGERSTVTDAVGYFEFARVQPAAAVVTVGYDHFATRTVRLDRPRRDLRVTLEPLQFVDAVTVTAADIKRLSAGSRTGTPARDVPQAATIISRELIADQMMQGMGDVTNYVPGVGMAQGEGHRDAPVFRGNTSTSDFFVDGMRDDTQYLRDLYNVERIEVLKGPNGMMFGRGGVGGVINRVTREADWSSPRDFSVQTGSWGHRRLSADLGQRLGATTAARLTGMYENSDSYRDGVGLERYGFNPTVAFALGARTTLKAGYELFHDERTTDRGVPSVDGRPLETESSTFFGNADVNTARVTVNALSSLFEHTIGSGLTLRNRTRYADYDKFYQNLVPGAVNASRTAAALTGYNNDTQRRNFFSQTDLTLTTRTGRFGHTVLAGVEVGHQVTDNRRMTGYFPSLGATATAISVPLSNPSTALPVQFRSSATDARNHGVARMAAIYAQDQITLSRHVQAIVGLRYDVFDVDLVDHRSDSTLTSRDGLLSPRLALVYKPITPVSIYTSYGRSYLPRAGEQLSSLSPTTAALEPEVFRNVEIGAKWDVTPRLAFSTAAYRMTHGNVVVADPFDPTLSLLVDAERTSGLEIEVAGRITDRWNLQGGYALQDAEITRSLTAAIVAGARLAKVPRHSFALWNKYEVSRVVGVGLGLIARGDSFVATDNTVILPGFTRVDAGVFFRINPKVRAHVNVENLFDARYYASAHSNNNIMPGSPRALRLALTTAF